MDSAPRVLVKEGSIKVVAGNKNALNTISIKTWQSECATLLAMIWPNQPNFEKEIIYQ